MTSLNKNSSVGEDMRCKEVEQFLTASSFEYFGEQISAGLEGHTIEHKATEMFFDATVDILTQNRVISREGKCLQTCKKSLSWLAYLVLKIQQVNCQNNCLVRCAETEKKCDQVGDSLNSLLRKNGQYCAENFTDHIMQASFLKLKGKNANKFSQFRTVRIPQLSKCLPCQLSLLVAGSIAKRWTSNNFLHPFLTQLTHTSELY